MINTMKKKYAVFINKSKQNVLSSQTLYEALLANLNMFKACNENKYLEEAVKIGNLISNMQLKNGGFDIGYNFYFGINIKKSSEIQATTPEVLSIYALTELYKYVPCEKYRESIYRGIEWIQKNIYLDANGYYVIPYAPETINYVHITNGISFCLGAIANFLGTFHDSSLKNMFHSMCKYMANELCFLDDETAYWLYFEKEKRGSEEIYSKIDNYHIAQQLYYHRIAQQYISDENNDFIVKCVTNYMQFELRKKILIPYMVFLDTGREIDNCDVWGYSSILLAMLKTDNVEWAQKVKQILIEKYWQGNYFYPSIGLDYRILDNTYYPRSDAWVLHALSECYLHFNEIDVKKIIDIGLNKLTECNYMGAENHALTWRKEFGRKIKSVYRNVKRKTN